MIITLYIFFGLILIFGFVVFFGAPYLPTLASTKETALDLLDLKPGQVLLELGSGDGRVMVAAAQRGLHVVGYELNPLLVLISIYKTRHYRKLTKVVWGNFFNKNWPKHDAIFIFLVDRYMPQLDKKIRSQSQVGTVLVSNAFKMPGKKPITQKRGVYLYRY